MGISALVELLDAAGNRVDRALKTAGGYLPVRIKLGTGLTATAARNGPVVDANVAVDGAAVVTSDAVLAALANVGSAVNINGQDLIGVGKFEQGDLAQDAGTATTVGGASHSAIVSVPVASGELRALWLCVRATDGTAKYIYETPIGAAITTFGGSLSYLPGTPSANTDFPLVPTFAVTFSTGTLSVAVTGPSATITGTADNGSGKLRVAVASGTPATLQSWVGTINLTLAGLSGTPGGNGSHAATYVDATHFDLTGVAYVAPDASGTVTETTPRTVKWGVGIRVV